MSGRHYPIIAGRQMGKTSISQSYFQHFSSVIYPKILFPVPIIWHDFIEPGEEVMQPLSYYTQRKAWESKYDPKFHQKGGEIKVTRAPSVDNLPAKRWVLPLMDQETRELRTAHRRTILAWLREQNFKYQVCIVEIDKREREVFLFKKESIALMFKLAWG